MVFLISYDLSSQTPCRNGKKKITSRFQQYINYLLLFKSFVTVFIHNVMDAMDDGVGVKHCIRRDVSVEEGKGKDNKQYHFSYALHL